VSSDWSNPPYYVCYNPDCHEKWSISLLGEEEASRQFRAHIHADPCKTVIRVRRAAYKFKTRDRSWQFDQYVGSHRAEELGLWKSNTDPNRTWTVPGTVSITKDDIDNMILTVEADGEKLVIASDRDQWGTYYTIQSGKGSRKKRMAQEDGTRSFLRALIAGLQHLEQAMDYKTADPTEGTES
jgi:hypothetical protein